MNGSTTIRYISGGIGAQQNLSPQAQEAQARLNDLCAAMTKEYKYLLIAIDALNSSQANGVAVPQALWADFYDRALDYIMRYQTLKGEVEQSPYLQITIAPPTGQFKSLAQKYASFAVSGMGSARIGSWLLDAVIIVAVVLIAPELIPIAILGVIIDQAVTHYQNSKENQAKLDTLLTNIQNTADPKTQRNMIKLYKAANGDTSGGDTINKVLIALGIVGGIWFLKETGAMKDLFSKKKTT